MELEEDTDLVFQRHLGIDAMELKETDLLDSQPLEAALATFAEIFRTAIRRPLVRTAALEPGLGGDEQIRG